MPSACGALDFYSHGPTVRAGENNGIGLDGLYDAAPQTIAGPDDSAINPRDAPAVGDQDAAHHRIGLIAFSGARCNRPPPRLNAGSVGCPLRPSARIDLRAGSRQ